MLQVSTFTLDRLRKLKLKFGNVILAGGPGSGCHGDNCGRPSEGGTPTGGTIGPKTAVGVLKEHGFKPSGIKSVPHNIKPDSTMPIKMFSHPKYGEVGVTSNAHFIHYNKDVDNPQYQKSGNFGSGVQQYMKNLKSWDNPTPAPSATPVQQIQKEAAKPIPDSKAAEHQSALIKTNLLLNENSKISNVFNTDVVPVHFNGKYINLEKENSSHGLGGAHEKIVYKDTTSLDGDKYLFKPATDLQGKISPLMAVADEMASKIQAVVRPDANVPAHAMMLDGKLGSLQKMVPGAKPLTSIVQTPGVKAQLQQEQVADWLMGNHDAHIGQFVQSPDGKVYGVDKTQAYKHIGEDKLDPSYHPNAKFGEKEPVYNTLLAFAKSGAVQIDPNAVLPAIKNVEALPNVEFAKMIEPYADVRFKGDTDAKFKFMQQAIDRKVNIRSDFEKLYANVLNKPGFKFEGTKAEEKAFNGEPVHQYLGGMGYQLKNNTSDGDKASYEHPDGSVIYVNHKDGVVTYTAYTGAGLSKPEFTSTLNKTAPMSVGVGNSENKPSGGMGVDKGHSEAFPTAHKDLADFGFVPNGANKTNYRWENAKGDTVTLNSATGNYKLLDSNGNKVSDGYHLDINQAIIHHLTPDTSSSGSDNHTVAYPLETPHLAELGFKPTSHDAGLTAFMYKNDAGQALIITKPAPGAVVSTHKIYDTDGKLLKSGNGAGNSVLTSVKLYTHNDAIPLKEAPKDAAGFPVASNSAHTALDKAGFKYEGTSGKGFGLYKNPDGTKVYITEKTGDKFDVFKNGSTTKVTSVSDLKNTLAGKPITPKVPSTLPPENAKPSYDSLLQHVHSEDVSKLVDHTGKADYSSAEKQAVSSYKGSSATINGWLMSPFGNVGKNSDVPNKVSAIDSAMNKGVANKDLTLYRGIAGDHAEEIVKNLVVGSQYLPKTFQETSSNPNVSKHFTGSGNSDVMFKITVPKGTNVLPTTTITDSHKGEQGIILARGGYYQVNDIVKGSGGKSLYIVDWKHL